MKKSIVVLPIIMSIFLMGCSDEPKKDEKVDKNIKVNSYIKVEEDNQEEAKKEEEIFTYARNQSNYSSKIVETQTDFFYSSIDDNNRIYRSEKKDTKKSEVSMLSGKYLIEGDGKIYYSNSQDNGKIYFFESDKFDENIKSEKLNNYKSRDLVAVKEGLFYINEEDGEKIYFTSYDGKINKAVTQDRGAKFIIADNILYYQNANDGYKLYGVDLLDKTRFKITDFSVESFCSARESLIVTNSDDDNNIYIVYSNKSITKVSNVKAFNLKRDFMSDDKNKNLFYFVNEENNLIKASLGETLKVEDLNRQSSELVQEYYFTTENILVETQDEKYKSVIK